MIVRVGHSCTLDTFLFYCDIILCLVIGLFKDLYLLFFFNRELSALTGANGLKQKRTSRPKSSLNVYTSSESSSSRVRSTSGRRSPLPTRRQLEFCLVAPEEILGKILVLSVIIYLHG